MSKLLYLKIVSLVVLFFAIVLFPGFFIGLGWVVIFVIVPLSLLFLPITIGVLKYLKLG